MATVEQVVLRGERRIVLSGIAWELYEQLRENEDNWHVRMAYDKGRLELMSPSPDHEALKELICEMIKVRADAARFPLVSNQGILKIRKCAGLLRGLMPFALLDLIQ